MKNKILDIANKDLITLDNLEQSIKYAMNTGNHKIIYSAFKRTQDIMLRRRKDLTRELGVSTKTPSLQEILSTTDNETHKQVLRLLFDAKLKPSQVIKLVKNNRNETYSIRTIQKIRANALEKLNSSSPIRL